jgi:tetratricopeptide (TPR) repeat protein
MQDEEREDRATELAPTAVDDIGDALDAALDEAGATFERGFERLGSGAFAEAVQDFGAAGQHLRSVVEEAESPSARDDPTFRYEWIKRREEFEALALLAEGYRWFALGQSDRLSGRNPGAAVGHYKCAGEKFDRLNDVEPDGRWQALAAYSRVLSDVSSGFEKLLRADPASAAADFQRAKGALEVVVEDQVPELVASTPQDSEEHEGLIALSGELERDLLGVASFLQLARFRDEGAKGNWVAALTAAEELCDATEEHLSRVSPDAPRWFRRQIEAEFHTHVANREVMHGHVLKDQGKWDAALAAYAEARAELLRSAESYVKTGLPTAQAAQEACINQASTTIDVFIRQCQTERDLRCENERLRNELASLQSSLLERLKDRGIQVNTQASVMATIDQDAQIVQHVEMKVRDTIAEARHAIDLSTLDPVVKDALRSQAEALLATQEKGPGFLDKAKSFSEKVSAIVKNAAEAAGPLVPVAKALALLLL